MSAAATYIRDASHSMPDRYHGDCVTHACQIAALLLDEGRWPWIGRLRHETNTGNRVFRGPLIPKRFEGRNSVVWTTHYVACSERLVYDPLIGDPMDMDGYAWAVFGQPLAVEIHLDCSATEQLLLRGDLRRSFHPIPFGESNSLRLD